VLTKDCRASNDDDDDFSYLTSSQIRASEQEAYKIFE
jgi:hypothetical protein